MNEFIFNHSAVSTTNTISDAVSATNVPIAVAVGFSAPTPVMIITWGVAATVALILPKVSPDHSSRPGCLSLTWFFIPFLIKLGYYNLLQGPENVGTSATLSHILTRTVLHIVSLWK